MLWTDPKIIFIHIPKTGGSSIETILHRPSLLAGQDKRLGQHEPLQKAYDLHGDLSEYKIFTVMRNTYERLVSFYLLNYRRQAFNFLQMPEFKGTKYLTFPEYYNNVGREHIHCGDFFDYLSVNGEIPPQLKVLDFNNLEEEFMAYMTDDCGINIKPPFPHVNVNPWASDELRTYLLSDPEYHRVLYDKYLEEIEYFGYTP